MNTQEIAHIYTIKREEGWNRKHAAADNYNNNNNDNNNHNGDNNKPCVQSLFKFSSKPKHGCNIT